MDVRAPLRFGDALRQYGACPKSDVGPRAPICFEIFTLEARSTNLLSKETVFDRVVDMLQELSIDPVADRRGKAVGINQ